MQLPNTKEISEKAWLGWEGDPLWVVQESEIWPYRQMV